MKVVAYGFSDLHVLKRNGSKKNFFFFSASQDAKPKHTRLSVQRYKCLVQGAVGWNKNSKIQKIQNLVKAIGNYNGKL